MDLGAGTGALAASVMNQEQPIAERMTLVDRTPELLRVASQRHGQTLQYVTGDVLQLPFANESFDLAVSGGLVYLLGREAQEPYFREVSRVLRPGGVYIDGDQDRWHWTTANPGRSQLGSLIKACVEGDEILGDPLGAVDRRAFFSEVGLNFSEHMQPDPPNEPIIVRVLEKPA